MHYYEVTVPITLSKGSHVQLTEQQASLRTSALKKRKNNCYEVISPIQFKKGEILGFETTPDKAILNFLRLLEKKKED